jgi:hypothetical protein
MNEELYKYMSTQVEYDSDTGLFYWNSPRANNKIQAGDVAGSLHPTGYVKLSFAHEGRTRSISAHRLAYYMSYGKLPKVIDHANGNGSDNRIENLREATHQQNRMNARVRIDNASKVTGVYYRKDCDKWRAEICKDGNRTHLGFFKTKEEAIEARKEAEDELFGEFSSSNRSEEVVGFKPSPTTGRSGVRYVTWHKDAEKWQAKPIVAGKPISLGLFDTIEEASAKVSEWTTGVDAYFTKDSQ